MDFGPPRSTDYINPRTVADMPKTAVPLSELDMGKLEYSIVLFAFVAATSAGPAGLRPQDGGVTFCSQTCTESFKFNYEVGKTYEYKYEVETKTSVLGASADTSDIGINALATVEIVSKCEHVLKLSKVTIAASDSKKLTNQDPDGEFARGLETYPLRFSFQDGGIESVCPHEAEQAWALNIKKGLLSSFQNTMQGFQTDHNVTESDVVGKCRTEYKVAQTGWRSVTLKKYKNMDSCTQRNGFNTAIHMVPFSSGLKSLDILKGTYECDQIISTEGQVTSSHCHEVQLLRPFSKGESGATTETIQTLTFIQQGNSLSQNVYKAGKPQELFFDHDQGAGKFDLAPRDALLLLKDMCEETAGDIQIDTPARFSTLVHLMKRMDVDGLKRVYNQAHRSSFCRDNGERIQKFVTDAFPMVGTPPSVELMKTLISNNVVKGAQADSWLASITFIHKPTADMIEQVMQLTGIPSLSTKVLLPLSSLVHAYCHINPDCKDVREVREVIQLLERNIGDGCVADQKNFKKIMLSLRGLGNTGHADFATAELNTCINNQANSMDIRVAAIQAFRRLSCEADRTNLMSVFDDNNADFELRINAYLEVIRCPSPEVISRIRQILSAMEYQQVGSFVWTHLTNLMESNDPANKYIQQLLNDELLEKEFDLEKLKFSRNYEASAFFERYNVGGKFDSNVIFSEKSFVPRSASLNLTFNLFGESMNLFEVGGRVEGLEHLLESYFGTAGYFNNDDKSNNEVPQANAKLAKLSSSKLGDIHGKSKKMMDDLRGAVYTRMFGNEMSYNMFGANNGINEEKSKSDMFEFLKKLRNNEKQDLSMTKSIVFLDSMYTVPTIAGLPLNLNVNGTSTVALNADGKIDMKNPKSKVVIEGKFEPSGAVQVDSMMSVDAFVTKGGMKMASTLYTSTGAKATIELTNGNVFDLSFDLTKEKSEIIKVKTSFFMVHNEMEREQRMIVIDRYEQSDCSGDRVLKATGLRLCAEVSGPNSTDNSNAPNFPLTGPMTMAVSVEKKDLPNGYKMEAKTIKTPEQLIFRFLSNTPGSSNDRAIGLDIDFHQKLRTLDINFLSPWKKASMKGEMVDMPKLKGLVGTIDVDEGSRLYKLDAKVLINRIKDKTTFTPTITLEIPDWKNVYLTGLINYKDKESFDANMNITGAMDDPIMFVTSIQNTDKQVGIKSNLKWDAGEGYVFEAMSSRLVFKTRLSKKHTYSPRLYVRDPVKEWIDMTANIILVEGKSLKVDGKLDKLLDEPVTLLGTMLKTVNTKKKQDQYQGTVSVQASKKYTKFTFRLLNKNWLSVNNKMRLEYNFGRKVKDTIIMGTNVRTNSRYTNVRIKSTMNSLRNNDIDATFMATYNGNNQKKKVVSSLKYGINYKKKATKERVDFTFLTVHSMKKQKMVNYTMTLKLPAKEVDVTLNGGYIHDGKSIENDVSLTYHPKRSVSLNFKLHNKTNEFPHYAGEVGIGLPEGREMFFAGAFGKESKDKYVSNLEFEIIKGRSTKLDAMLKIATEKMYEVELGVQLPELEPVRVRGAYIPEKDGFKADASFKRGGKLYSIAGEALCKVGTAYKFVIDTTVPERRVKLTLDSSVIKSLRQNMIDIQWDADKNLNDRFLLNMTTDFKGFDDFEIASMLYYPSRTIEFQMKHSSGARYITSAELSWSPKDKMEMKIIFRDDQFNDDDRTELSVEFFSPFEDYEELGLAVSIIRDDSQYQTKSSITWGKNKKILVSASAKFPITVNSVDMAGTINTPFKSYGKMVASIKHRFSDNLDTSVLIDWGRQRIVTKVKSTWEMSAIKRSFTGNLEVRTPFDGLRIYLLDAKHNDDGRKFSSRLESDITVNSTQVTGNKYIVEMDMTHDKTVAILDNRGIIEVTIPQDYFSTVWEVNSQLGRNHLLFDIQPQRGNRFKVAFDETHQFKPYRKFYSNFELLIPMEQVKELNAKFEHEDRENYLKTETTVTKDRVQLYFEKVLYERNLGHIQFDTEIKSVYSEDVIIKMVTSHSIMPYNIHMTTQWAPYQVIDVNTYIFYDKFGTYDVSIDLSTPFQQVKNVKFKTQRLRQGLNWEVNADLEFAPRQKITVETIYRIDHVKLTSVSIRTPFPQFSNLDASFKINGNALKLDGEAEIQVAPYLNKLSTNFNWAYYEGTSLEGEFNLNTPFPQYPYMKAKVNSNMLGMSRLSMLEVEYLPTQVVKIESDYRFSSLDTLRGTVKVTSPYTENKQVVASFTHVGDKEEFTTDAKITCECFERAAFTKATFSSKDAIALTFVMDSPFKGYETVNLKFNHRGELKDFHTNFEYETNGETLSLESVFSIKKDIELQMTLLTPFVNMTRSHFELTQTGKFPNTRTLTEIAFNNQEGHSDISLSHNDLSTILTTEITTPFTRYEKLTGKIMRQGDLKDFRAEGELKYDQLWKATYTHLFSTEYVSASALLTSPLQDEDFIFQFNQTNKMDDFSSSALYSMGPAYTSTSEIILKTKDLPNLEFKAKTNTVMKEEQKSNEIQLLNAVEDNNRYFKLYATVPRVFADIEMTLKADVDKQFDFDSHLILDLPIETLASTAIVYKSTMETLAANQQTSRTEFTMDTTMLERVSQIQTQEFFIDKESGKFNFARKTVSSYGEDFYTEDVYFDAKKFSLDYSSSFEGYENATLVVEYSGSVVDALFDKSEDSKERVYSVYYSRVDKTSTLSLVGTFTSNALPGPVIANYDVKLGSENEVKLQLELPFDDYKSTDAVMTYEYTDKYAMDLTVENTALDIPVKASANLRHKSLINFEMTAMFTSGITNFTNFDLEVRTTQEPSAAYKPYLKVSWEDSDVVAQVIEVDSMYKWMQLESGGTELGAGLSIQTPFTLLKEANFQYNYEVALSPLRLKQSALAQYNTDRYLDFDAEFSALNTFQGSVIFRAPRAMTYTLTAENQGESVNGDLVLDWNKEDPNSFFRLQFGLSDSGDLTVMNKTFLIRVTRPDRIVGIHNQLVRSVDEILSTGKVAWDEKNKKEATYDLKYTLNKLSRDDILHDAIVKVTVPSRSVEVSGTFKDLTGEKLVSGNVLWDAENDRNKQVDVKLVVSPYSIKKTGALHVSLPSVNKKLTLTSDLVLGEGRQILGGQTKFSYSPSEDKTVLMDYAILEEEIGTNNYRMTWSLEHKDTRTYIDMNTLVKGNDGVVSGDMDLKYRKINGKLEELSLKGEANMDARKAFIKIITSDDSAELTGHVTHESPYVMTLSTLRKDQETGKTIWSVDTTERTLDASMTYGAGTKTISTRASLPTDKSFVSETDRTTELGTVQEGQLSAQLEYRKLHGHIKWRPELVKDVMTFSGECMKDLITELSDIFERRGETFGVEMMGKYKLVRASITEELAPLMDSLDAELKEFQRELRNVRRELKKMYKQNDLYIKTIDEMYGGAVQKLMASYSATIAQVGEVYKTLEEKMEEMSNKITDYPLKEKYNQMIEEAKVVIEKTKENIRTEIDILFNTMRKNINMVVTLYDEAIADISTTTRKYISKLVEETLLTPQIDQLKEAYANLLVTVGPNLEASRAEIQTLLTQVQEIIMTTFNDGDWVEKYKRVYEKTQAILSKHFEVDAINSEILMTLEDLQKQIAIVTKYIDMDMDTKVLEEVVAMVREKMMEEFNQLPLGLLDLHKSRFETFDLENGEIEFDLYLPIPMENFEKLMRFTFDKYMKRLNQMAKKYFPRGDFVLSDFYYRFTPIQWSLKRDWLPPFDAFATVSGMQHYTTFDGSHLDIAGLCSYVLVTDVVDGNFTIVQKYTGGPRQLSRSSLVVMIHGQTIELFSDYKIKIDDQPREFPYITDHVELVRSGSHVKLTSKYGIEVIADFEREFHIIGLSGWYFGKVAGILGTYDNEPSNDLISPEGIVEPGMRRFMNAWEVEASCRSSRNYANTETPRKTEVCSNAFEKTASSLRPCFLQVDPAHYQRSCDHDQASLCNLATLYSQVCSRSGITVSLPAQCMKCDDSKGSTFHSGETLRFERQHGNPRQEESHDVVMIVEEKQCNRDVIDKLTSVVYEMDQSMNRAGSINNRFSLLGYTEDQVYQHTMEGQTFNSADKFAMAIESLKLASSGLVADPFTAIQRAVDLPYRPGVSKVFVLVSCMACEQNEYSYRVLSNSLEQRDITLHVLRKTGFHLKTNRSPKSLIYGYDKDQLMTGLTRQAKPDKHEDVDIPADYCSTLAVRTNGSIFDSSHIISGQVRQQKEFMKVVSDRLSNVDEPNGCQVCSCETDALGMPQSVCRRCDAQTLYFKHVPSMMSSVTSLKNGLTNTLQKLF